MHGTPLIRTAVLQVTDSSRQAHLCHCNIEGYQRWQVAQLSPSQHYFWARRHLVALRCRLNPRGGQRKLAAEQMFVITVAICLTVGMPQEPAAALQNAHKRYKTNEGDGWFVRCAEDFASHNAITV